MDEPTAHGDAVLSLPQASVPSRGDPHHASNYPAYDPLTGCHDDVNGKAALAVHVRMRARVHSDISVTMAAGRSIE
jgi:hypothetical protein